MASSKDVAKLAGCSQATVSRVLNNPQSVNPQIRENVLAAIQALHYQPNLAARSLVSKSSRTIALISGTLKNDFFVESADQIVNYASNLGYKTMVYFESEGNLGDILATVRSYKVDGILLSSIKLDDEHFDELENCGIPYMLFNRRHRSGGNYVAMDNETAGEMLTRHLLDNGHRLIAYMSGHLNISTFYERKVGFDRSMAAAGLAIRSDWVHLMDTSAVEVRRLTRSLMEDELRPTAIICATDEMALACMDALMSMKLRIPEDVSLAGFDDINMAAHPAIQLTSIGQHEFRMGEVAAKHLFAMIEAGDTKEQHVQIRFKPELYIRKTTKWTAAN